MAAEAVNTNGDADEVCGGLFHELPLLMFFVLLQGGNVMLIGVAIQMCK